MYKRILLECSNWEATLLSTNINDTSSRKKTEVIIHEKELDLIEAMTIIEASDYLKKKYNLFNKQK